jgi:hypothetical protein
MQQCPKIFCNNVQKVLAKNTVGGKNADPCRKRKWNPYHPYRGSEKWWR